MQLRHQVICFQSEINVGTIWGIVIIIIIIGFLAVSYTHLDVYKRQGIETVVKAVKYSRQ